MSLLITPAPKAEAKKKSDWGPPAYYVCARKSAYRSVRPWAFERLQKLFFRPTTVDCDTLMRALGPDERLQKTAGITHMSSEELEERLAVVDFFQGTREDRFAILKNLVSSDTPENLWDLLVEKVAELKIDFTDFDLTNQLSTEELQSFVDRLLKRTPFELMESHYSKNLFHHSQLAKTIVLQSIQRSISYEYVERVAVFHNAWAEVLALPLEERIQIFTDYLNRPSYSEASSAKDALLTKDTASRFFQLVSDWQAFTTGKTLDSTSQKSNPFHYLHSLEFDSDRRNAPELPASFGQVPLMIERLVGFISYNYKHFDEDAYARWMETLFFARAELLGVTELKYEQLNLNLTAQDRKGNNILHYYFKNLSYKVGSNNECRVDRSYDDSPDLYSWLRPLLADTNMTKAKNHLGYRPIDYLTIEPCSLGKGGRPFVIQFLKETQGLGSFYSAKIKGRTLEELLIEAEQSLGFLLRLTLGAFNKSVVRRMDTQEALQQIKGSGYFLSKFIEFGPQFNDRFDLSELAHIATIQLNGHEYAIDLSKLSKITMDLEFIRIARNGFQNSDEGRLLDLVINRLYTEAAAEEKSSRLLSEKSNLLYGIMDVSRNSVYDSKTALYTQMAKKSGQGEVLYNIESTQPLLAYRDGRVQCYSGTFLMNLIFIKKGLLQSKDSEAVVIFTEGHVQPGIIHRVPKKGFRLTAIEMTTRGRGLVEYGWTHQIEKPVRVVTLKDFLIEYMVSHTFTDAQAATQEMVARTHKKYHIPLLETNSTNAPVAMPSLGYSGSPFAFGQPTTPAGDRAMPEVETVNSFADPVTLTAIPGAASAFQIPERSDLGPSIEVEVGDASVKLQELSEKDLKVLAEMIARTIWEEYDPSAVGVHAENNFTLYLSMRFRGYHGWGLETNKEIVSTALKNFGIEEKSQVACDGLTYHDRPGITTTSTTINCIITLDQ